MGISHRGSNLLLERDFILPVDSTDRLFPFYWNTSSRGLHPMTDITSFQTDKKFGRVISVEESTVNHVPVGLRTCSALPEQLTLAAANTTSTKTIVTNYHGRDDVIRLTMDTSTEDAYLILGFNDAITAEIGDVFTFSYEYKIVKGVSYPIFSTVYANGYKVPNDDMAATLDESVTTELENGWMRVTRKGTITIAGNTWFRLNYFNRFVDSEALLDNFQIEMKPYGTSFADGTRQTGQLTYPKEILNVNTFTISTWSKFNRLPLADNTLTDVASIFDVQHASSSTNRLMLGISKSTDTLMLFVGTGVRETLTTSFTPVRGKWYMISLTFDGTSYRIYVDGKLIDTGVIGPAVLLPTATFNIGGKHNGNINGQLSNFLILDRAVSKDELSMWFEYGKAFYDPYDYTAVYA